MNKLPHNQLIDLELSIIELTCSLSLVSPLSHQ